MKQSSSYHPFKICIFLILLYSTTILRKSSSLSTIPPPATTFHIAPMQCYTNKPLRHLYNLLSPSSIKWTEMEKVNDIFPSPQHLQKALLKRLGPPEEETEEEVILQLGCNDPAKLQSCVQHVLSYGYENSIKEVNLNCGCPSIESGGAASYVASLMKDIELTAQLVQAAYGGIQNAASNTPSSSSSSSTLPNVSVKCRIATFDHLDDMTTPLTDSHYDYLQKYVSAIQDAGASHVILHARPAILSGLNPTQNRIVPELNYGFVEQIAEEFRGRRRRMDVTLNGGIADLDSWKELVKKYSGGGCSGGIISSFMAGRWCLRRPLDLLLVEDLLLQPSPHEKNEIMQDSRSKVEHVIDQYVNYAIQMAMVPKQQQLYTMAELCLPLYLIVEQLRDDYDYYYYYDDDEDGMEHHNTISPKQKKVVEPELSHDDIEYLYAVVQSGANQLESSMCSNGSKKKKKSKLSSSPNFKKLASSFKSIVGTKVVNKWKRNRAEL